MAESEKKYPAWPLYVKDYLADADVSLMPLTCQGAYVRLCCYAWQNGCELPNDREKLERLSGLRVERDREVDDAAWNDMYGDDCGSDLNDKARAIEKWDSYLGLVLTKFEEDPERPEVLVHWGLKALWREIGERSSKAKAAANRRWKNDGGGKSAGGKGA